MPRWLFRRRKGSDAEHAPESAEHRRLSLDRIAAKLDEIEAELKSIGFWHPEPRDVRSAYETGKAKTYLDAPAFELWLQQVFLPNARRAVAEDDLPAESDVGLMAMRQYATGPWRRTAWPRSGSSRSTSARRWTACSIRRL